MAPMSPDELVAAKAGRRVSMCIPARDEAATVGDVVRAGLAASPVVDEVVVVDDGSNDGTGAAAADAGARVIRGDGRGKGAAMRRAVAEVSADIVVFADADLRGFSAEQIRQLVTPLLTDPGIHLVKATYDRMLDGRAGEGGRVNDLVARPLLRVLFPELAWVRQPLGGEFAARRSTLTALSFVEGWGVDVGLVIDVAGAYGPASIAQIDLGERRHTNKALAELTPQAEVVLRTVLARAGLGDPVAQLPPLDSESRPTRAARTA